MQKISEYYPPYLKWSDEITPQPVGELLNYAVKNFPYKTAIDFFNKPTGYAELGDKVDEMAKALIKLGVKKDMKVGIYMPNHPCFVIAYFAILKASGVVVNYSPLYSEGELEFQVKDSDTEILITLDLKMLYPKAVNLVKKSQDEGGLLKKVIVAKFAEGLPFPTNLFFKIFKWNSLSRIKCNGDTIISWNKLIKCHCDDEVEFPEINVEDTALIQYTGGTTGTPKGAELTHKNVYVNAMQSKNFCIRTPDGKGAILTVLPLFHVFAMTTCMNMGIACGRTLILHPRFDIQKVLTDIQNKKPTEMAGVASLFNAINNFPETKSYDLTSLKVCVCGGGPLPIEIKKRFEEISHCALIEGYGLTEASPVVTCNPPEGYNNEGSIGLPFQQTELLIEDIENRGNFLGTSERGELCIKGPQVMKGYYKKPEETTKVLTVDGLLKTGDVAVISEDGYVTIVDRLKEMIIAGGFKIYPRNVEEIIYKHPDVLECAVIGIPDEHSGQKAKFFVVFKKGCTKTSEEMMDYFSKHLAKHEMPKELEFKEHLPKSPIGKILKKELC